MKLGCRSRSSPDTSFQGVILSPIFITSSIRVRKTSISHFCFLSLFSLNHSSSSWILVSAHSTWCSTISLRRDVRHLHHTEFHNVLKGCHQADLYFSTALQPLKAGSKPGNLLKTQWSAITPLTRDPLHAAPPCQMHFLLL